MEQQIKSGSFEIENMAVTANHEIVRGNYEAAAQLYSRILVNVPDNADLHHVYGLTLSEIYKFDQAVEEIETAIRLDRGKVQFYRSLGDVLFHKKEWTAAERAYRHSLQLMPNDVDTLLNLGNLLNRTGERGEAIALYQKVLRLAPFHSKALCNLGKTTFDLGDIDLSLLYYDKALGTDPAYAEAHFNKAVSLLMLNDYANGWKEYEWRFQRSKAEQIYPHHLSGKRWCGENLQAKKILIHCEQGFGDMIQFSRLLKRLNPLKGHLLFEVQAPLAPLFEEWGIIDELLVFDPNLPPQVPYDYHCPLLSLNHILNVSPEQMTFSIPYIHAPADHLQKWCHIQKAKGIRVGIVWQGSDTDSRRQCRLQDLEPLLALKDITFFSLQTGAPVQQLQLLKQPYPISDCGSNFQDFGDTAAVISQLDLVISIDTATAHLAGAMAKPVWIMLPKVPDWRWRLSGNHTNWYPTARLFRQTHEGSWDQTISAIAEALEKFIWEYPTGNISLTVASGPKQTAEDLFHQAVSLYQYSLLSDAAALFHQVIQLDPNFKEAHFNLGLIFQQTGHMHKAEDSYTKAIEFGMKTSQLFNNLGVIYEEQHKYREALTLFKKASLLDSDFADGHYNAGNLHLRLGELNQAKNCFLKAIQCNSEHPKALCNLGRVFHLTGNLSKALATYSEALAMYPYYPEAHFNRGITLLLDGQWQKGWLEYEWRFQCHDAKRTYPHKLEGKRWRGESFKGKTLLIHSEQGIGDAIQMARFLPLVKALGGRIVFEVRRSLLSFFEQFSGIVDELVPLSSEGPTERPFDFYTPLLSLPGIFQTTPETVPQSIPYLAADQSKVTHWKTRMPQARLFVGFVWSGNDTYKDRACTLSHMLPLFNLPDIHWVSLQKGPATSQLDGLSANQKRKISDWGSEFDDFHDTAAAIDCLDLIVSIDTAVAHLAGAMGKRTWILLPLIPDWRWLLNGSISPWYPTARLFRQSCANKWEDVIWDLQRELGRLRDHQNGLTTDQKDLL